MDSGINYKFVNLPTYFTDLLRSNMQSTSPAFTHLGQTIVNNSGLFCLVKRCFSDISANANIKLIINSIGWLGMRDRLVAVFLEYDQNGYFPFNPNLDLIEDICRLEDLLKPYTVDGYSRSFLLGMYLKMMGKDLSKEYFADISYLLKLFKSREIKIDWVVLTLGHYCQFIGKETLEKMICSGASYFEFYDRLGVEDRVVFTKNLLAYGASINEEDMFIDDTI